jgi:hypothetical protein
MSGRDDAELIEPSGEDAGRFDVPTIFYLTHREHIERWYALRRRADEVVNDYLLGLAVDLETVAEEGAFHIRSFDTGRFRCLLLWPEGATLDSREEPPIAAGLRWDRTQIALDDEARPPRIGVRVGRGSAEFRERFLSSGSPDTRQLRQQHGYRSDRRWPVFREMPAGPGWWADLDAYRTDIIDAIEQLIRQFADRIRTTYS